MACVVFAAVSSEIERPEPITDTQPEKEELFNSKNSQICSFNRNSEESHKYPMIMICIVLDNYE